MDTSSLIKVEVIVENSSDAILAQQYGANRLELIDDFSVGGLTPKRDIIRTVCDAVDIPVNVMLRPHAKSFVYDANDITLILDDLQFIKNNTKANGIVFGALSSVGDLDVALLETIIAHKGRLQLTFHRAIDEAQDIIHVYKQLIAIGGVDLVLTSGGARDAYLGIDKIAQMAALSSKCGNPYILAGAGINSSNVLEIINNTGVQQIHLGTGVRDGKQLSRTKFELLFAELTQLL